MQTDIKTRISDDVKTSLKGGEKQRLAVLRLISAAIKQREVDERIVLDDSQVIAVLDKMAKQRRESLDIYQKANRMDLADQEKFELDLILSYMPAQLDECELNALINAAISQLDAQGVADVGKVIACLKLQVQGRADMSTVSAAVKKRLIG